MIGLIGGTGPEGRGLALRFALAGEQVIIGSRDLERAAAAAQKVLRSAPGSTVHSAVNQETAEAADPVFITLPYSAQRSTLEALAGRLAGKVVVSTVAPLAVEGGVARAIPVPEGSAAMQAKAVLTGSSVVAAFQTTSARDLLALGGSPDSDVVVCGDETEARHAVMALASRIPGLRSVDGGGLENAVYVENLTALLLNINRRYKAHSGIKITGI